MATRGRPAITDPKQRARICRCYAETQSLEVTGRAHGVSDETVRTIINEDQPGLVRPGKKRKAG